jgi:hypothetical protein
MSQVASRQPATTKVVGAEGRKYTNIGLRMATLDSFKRTRAPGKAMTSFCASY